MVVPKIVFACVIKSDLFFEAQSVIYEAMLQCESNRYFLGRGEGLGMLH